MQDKIKKLNILNPNPTRLSLRKTWVTIVGIIGVSLAVFIFFTNYCRSTISAKNELPSDRCITIGDHSSNVSLDAEATCIPSPTNLVSWYRAENNATDFTGTNNGTLQNGTAFAIGKVGQAFNFDGNDDYVSINRTIQDDFTIEFWLNTTQIVGSDGAWWAGPGLVDGEVISVTNDFGVTLLNGKVHFGIGNPDVTIRSGFVADGNWHHVAATRTRNSGAMKLYIDGIEVANATAGTQSLTAPPRLTIGKLQPNGGYQFQGKLDEVSIYDRPLSASEIQSIYNADSSGKCNSSCSYSVSPINTTFPSAGGNGSFSVTSSVGCVWTALSNASWITTTSTGSGTGTVTFTVTANTGAVRTGTITVGDQTFTIIQSASGETKVVASDSSLEALFGSSVAIYGDTAVVGSPKNFGPSGGNFLPGSAYIFVRNSNGTWSQQAILLASDGIGANAQNKFGTSVAIEGDTVVIGTPADNVGSNVDQGSVYVFVRNGTNWTQQAKLVASDGASLNQIGTSVAISANTVVAGALGPGDAVPGINGAAYVFMRNGTTWTQQQKLTANDGAEHDYFGVVAISGNTIVVGAYGDDIGTIPNQGSAYVFIRNGTIWTQQQKLTASDANFTNLVFGISVGIEDNTIIVGRSKFPLDTGDPGSAYVFTRIGTTWMEQQKIVANDGLPRDLFGTSVSISENRILVGASGRGSTYIFAKNGTTWTQQQKFLASDGGANDAFGSSVAINNSSIIIGSPNNNSRGSAYIFQQVSNLRNPSFDFDGDGKADVSAFRPSNGVWYLQQSTNGFTGVSFGQNGDRIVPADYDGDGKTDVAVFRSGTWYLQRSATGFTGIAFGDANDIPVPADYDGDGKADVAVFRPSTGVWYLLQSTAGFTGVSFGQAGDKPVAGDYDGDGKADVAVNRNGVWYIQRSQAGFIGVSFGDGADKLVPADYDGDGKTDIAVFRPSNGTWYLQQSTGGFTGIQFGISTDLPVPADYDGDGKTDVAVFRAGSWYLNRSTQGFTGVNFGVATDQPIPNAFVR